MMDRQRWLEWTGVGTAILYSMLIALNIGAEFVGFFFAAAFVWSDWLMGPLWKASWHYVFTIILCHSWLYWHGSLVLMPKKR